MSDHFDALETRQVANVARQHPELLRVRLVVTREAEQDIMTLKAETATSEPG
jgi:hypothetical protein